MLLSKIDSLKTATVMITIVEKISEIPKILMALVIYQNILLQILILESSLAKCICGLKSGK